jgi:REP element-mobilizing transposase RayT
MAERDSHNSRNASLDYDEVEGVVRHGPPVLPYSEPVEQDVPAIQGEEGGIVLEPVTPDLYGVKYTCLLIPRFPTHYLMGDLAVSLQEWMPQISIAFGWRLEFLSIKPAHLEWALLVHPTTSPGLVMRTFRRQTSMRIFEDFARLKRENLSDDFWAPGYLITPGTMLHPPEMIDQFIRMTRHNQGIEPG